MNHESVSENYQSVEMDVNLLQDISVNNNLNE